jgi:PadR family transcriptional regulator, regulatory protein PadR
VARDAATMVRASPGNRFLLTIYMNGVILLLLSVNRRLMITANKAEVLQGTLDLLLLKTLDALGPLHGFGIARRIQQVSEDMLQLNQGTLYPALVRLEQRGWIRSKWGVSENKRRARFYSLTKSGHKQLAVEAQSWERMASLITRLLRGAEQT